MVLTPLTTAAIAAAHPVLGEGREDEKIHGVDLGHVSCWIDISFSPFSVSVFERVGGREDMGGERRRATLGLGGREERVK